MLPHSFQRTHYVGEDTLRTFAYTIFQVCSPEASIHRVAAVPAVSLVDIAAHCGMSWLGGHQGYQDGCDNAQSDDDMYLRHLILVG